MTLKKYSKHLYLLLKKKLAIAMKRRTLSSGVEVDIAESVPKTMKVIAKRLMYRLKTDLAWTDRGELVHDGAPVPGCNITDLVNEVFGKLRKSEPIDWQTFVQQLNRINLQMEIVGNVDRRRYIQKGTVENS